MKGFEELAAEVDACQCPPTGHTHFYDELKAIEKVIATSVNALQRATLISTVPPQEPLFYKASRTPFCRLFTEYSEKGVFSGIYLYVHSLFIFKPVSKPSLEASSPVYHTTL